MSENKNKNKNTVTADGSTVDLSEYVLKSDLVQAAEELCKDHNWCETPFSMLAELGVSRNGSNSRKLDTLGIGSVVGVRTSYQNLVHIKTGEDAWVRTSLDDFNTNGAVYDKDAVGVPVTDANITQYSYFVIHAVAVEQAEAAEDASVDLGLYLRKDLVLKTAQRWLGDHELSYHTTVHAKLETLGFELPPKPKASDLPVGAVVSTLLAEGRRWYTAVKSAEGVWMTTRHGSLRVGGNYQGTPRVTATDADVELHGFYVMYHPEGVYADTEDGSAE